MYFWAMFPYLVMLVPTLLIFAQMLCEGYYKNDPSFVYRDTSHLDITVVEHGVRREVLHIPVEGDMYGSVLHAWLLTPETSNSTTLPVIIMSHGIGGQKDMGLLKPGMAFAQAGYATVLFDYRHFGGSYTTRPAPYRNFIYPWHHVDDILTVVRYVQEGKLPARPAESGITIDTTRIVLWGSSFAGGHVLSAAARLPPGALAGVISQIPHLDGKRATQQAIAKRGLQGTIRVLCLAIADAVLSTFAPLFLPPDQYSPIYVPIAGKLGEVGYMTMDPIELEAYYSKHPEEYLGGWRNLAPARTLAVLSLYNPGTSLAKFPAATTPLLFVLASRDTLCPPDLVRENIAQHAHLSGKVPQHLNIIYALIVNI